MAEFKKIGYQVARKVDQYIKQRFSKEGIDYFKLKEELTMLNKQITLIQISM